MLLKAFDACICQTNTVTNWRFYGSAAGNMNQENDLSIYIYMPLCSRKAGPMTRWEDLADDAEASMSQPTHFFDFLAHLFFCRVSLYVY